jgi:S-(hydroxymethyl)glutathione dehydrogenase / alcohol dehydrogenase
MRAAVLEHLNAPLTIADVEPGPVGTGQALVKVLVSGICGAQLQEIAGNKGNAKFVPHLLGHEGCGIVEEVGHGITTVKKGDKVVMHWRKGEGIEADFPSYSFKGRLMRSGKVTTFNQYAIVSENRITAVPSDTPDDFCALLGCGLSTALGTVIDEAKVRPGESVLIVGLGGVGASLVRAARLVGASPVIAIDISETKRAMAASLGCDLFIKVEREGSSAALRDLLRIPDVDVIIETSGNPKSIANTLPLLASGGRYILLGQPKPGDSVEITNAYHLFGGDGKSIMATQGGRFLPSQDIPRYVRLERAGLLRYDDLITHRTTLEGVNDALVLMRAGQGNRIFIDLWAAAA